jgi:signal peptidase complex subunit 3
VRDASFPLGHAAAASCRNLHGLISYSSFLVLVCMLASAPRAVVETLQLHQLRSLKSHGGVDRALLSFDLKVDLTPAFHWNIKQLFVYVVAVYETKGRLNQVVLWDKIVEAGDPKVIDESNVFVKYALVDQGDELRGKQITLQLQWDHMPITGVLHMDEQPIKSTSQFQLPESYQ